MQLVKNKLKQHKTAESMALEWFEIHESLSSRKEIPQEK